MSDLKKDAITVLTAIELAQRLDGMVQARFAARWSDGKLALERIVRLAARVEEGWCFDMEGAPRNGSDILGYWKRSNLYDVICWNDLRETKDCWETSDDACAMSPPTCWMRIPSPETTDGR